MTGLHGYWRLQRRLWQIKCNEESVYFRERHRMTVSVLLLFYLSVVALSMVLGFPGALGILTRGRGPTPWINILIAANGLALFLTVFTLVTVRKTVIRVDPFHLHVAWRGIRLHDVPRWQRVEGAVTREWRRKPRRPMGRSAISLGASVATGNFANAFCPVWMRTALLIELRGLHEPEHVLVGTDRPEEFEAALVHATSKLGPTQRDMGWLDDRRT